MSIPATGLESVWRNSLDDVWGLLRNKHKGAFMIWNLSERVYDYTKFDNFIVEFFFPDHHPPPLDMMFNVVDSMDRWFRADERNIAVVHCKGGKGRTGTVIACYLFYDCLFDSITDAAAHFALRRSAKRKGITQAGQRRYIHYFSDFLTRPVELKLRRVYVRGMLVGPLPPNAESAAVELYDYAAMNVPEHKARPASDFLIYTSPPNSVQWRFEAGTQRPYLEVRHCALPAGSGAAGSADPPSFVGDVLIRCVKDTQKDAKQLFHAVLHSSFFEPSDFVLKLPRKELDHIDKSVPEELMVQFKIFVGPEQPECASQLGERMKQKFRTQQADPKFGEAEKGRHLHNLLDESTADTSADANAKEEVNISIEVRNMAAARKLQQIQQSLVGADPFDLTLNSEKRSLLLEGELTRHGEKSKEVLRVFLFNDMMLLTKPSGKSNAFKEAIPFFRFASVRVVEVPKTKYAFRISLVAPDETLVLSAPTAEDRDAWLEEFGDLLEDDVSSAPPPATPRGFWSVTREPGAEPATPRQRDASQAPPMTPRGTSPSPVPRGAPRREPKDDVEDLPRTHSEDSTGPIAVRDANKSPKSKQKERDVVGSPTLDRSSSLGRLKKNNKKDDKTEERKERPKEQRKDSNAASSAYENGTMSDRSSSLAKESSRDSYDLTVGSESDSDDELEAADGVLNLESDDHHVMHVGWLLKQGPARRSWKRRWVVLTRGGLFYFEKPKSVEPLGVVALRNFVDLTPDTDADTRKSFSFSLETKARRYNFCADTAVERLVWQEHLLTLGCLHKCQREACEPTADRVSDGRRIVVRESARLVASALSLGPLLRSLIADHNERAKFSGKTGVAFPSDLALGAGRFREVDVELDEQRLRSLLRDYADAAASLLAISAATATDSPILSRKLTGLAERCTGLERFVKRVVFLLGDAVSLDKDKEEPIQTQLAMFTEAAARLSSLSCDDFGADSASGRGASGLVRSASQSNGTPSLSSSGHYQQPQQDLASSGGASPAALRRGASASHLATPSSAAADRDTSATPRFFTFSSPSGVRPQGLAGFGSRSASVNQLPQQLSSSSGDSQAAAESALRRTVSDGSFQAEAAGAAGARGSSADSRAAGSMLPPSVVSRHDAIDEQSAASARSPASEAAMSTEDLEIEELLAGTEFAAAAATLVAATPSIGAAAKLGTATPAGTASADVDAPTSGVLVTAPTPPPVEMAVPPATRVPENAVGDSYAAGAAARSAERRPRSRTAYAAVGRGSSWVAAGPRPSRSPRSSTYGLGRTPSAELESVSAGADVRPVPVDSVPVAGSLASASGGGYDVLNSRTGVVPGSGMPVAPSGISGAPGISSASNGVGGVRTRRKSAPPAALLPRQSAALFGGLLIHAAGRAASRTPSSAAGRDASRASAAESGAESAAVAAEDSPPAGRTTAGTRPGVHLSLPSAFDSDVRSLSAAELRDTALTLADARRPAGTPAAAVSADGPTPTSSTGGEQSPAEGPSSVVDTGDPLVVASACDPPAQGADGEGSSLDLSASRSRQGSYDEILSLAAELDDLAVDSDVGDAAGAAPRSANASGQTAADRATMTTE